MRVETRRLWPRRSLGQELPLGLSCDDEGLLLAGNCRLISAVLTPDGCKIYKARLLSEVNAVLSAGYGTRVNVSSAYPALERLARHMSLGDWTRATIAALHLGLPDLADQKAAHRVLAADQLLKTWNSDLHPRWPEHSSEGQGGRFRPKDGGDGFDALFQRVASDPELKDKLHRLYEIFKKKDMRWRHCVNSWLIRRTLNCRQCFARHSTRQSHCRN